MKARQKKIKVLTKGPVITSKGTICGPILRPFMESLDTILTNISRFNLDIVEVLDNGNEVKLTIFNFDKDNNKKPETIETVKVRKEQFETPAEPTQPINKHMSNKEKRRMEREKAKMTNTQESVEEVVVEEVKEKSVEKVTETPVTNNELDDVVLD